MPIRISTCLLALFLIGCGKPQEPVAMLPDFGQFPEFELQDQSNRPFTRNQLAGKVWIMDFIFTRCQAVCPRMTAQMRKIQDLVASNPEVRLLSVSIDPEFDSTKVLLQYAASYQADTARWFFLTGEKQTIRRMQEKTQRHLDPDEITAHSKQFYLVDSNGFVRGVYSITQPRALEDMLQDLQRLQKSQAKPEPAAT